MATYAFGDIHGCFKTLQAVLRRIDFDPRSDHLWFVGDLVNRGPRNLETLNWVYEHSARINLVLGNHDVHLIRRHLGLTGPRASDTLDDLLGAPEREQLINWLRRRPFIHDSGSHVLVHAGVLPAWGLTTAMQLTARAERDLQENPETLFRKPRSPMRSSLGPDGMTSREIMRVLTRVRLCRSPQEPDLDFTGPPEAAPPGLRPWFEFPSIREHDRVFIFGHWAQMGCRLTSHAYCLDSGCVYGGPLSAIRLEDGRLFQQENLEG